MQGFIEHQGQVVKTGHYILLRSCHLGCFALGNIFQGDIHVFVDEVDFMVNHRRQLGHTHAQGKKRVFDHLGIIFQFALHLTEPVVVGVLLVG